MTNSQIENSVRAIIQMTAAIGGAIQELGTVREGDMYARVMGQMQLRHFKAIIDKLVEAKLVRRGSDHMLTWIGPVYVKPMEDGRVR